MFMLMTVTDIDQKMLFVATTLLKQFVSVWMECRSEPDVDLLKFGTEGVAMLMMNYFQLNSNLIKDLLEEVLRRLI